MSNDQADLIYDVYGLAEAACKTHNVHPIHLTPSGLVYLWMELARYTRTAEHRFQVLDERLLHKVEHDMHGIVQHAQYRGIHSIDDIGEVMERLMLPFLTLNGKSFFTWRNELSGVRCCHRCGSTARPLMLGRIPAGPGRLEQTDELLCNECYETTEVPDRE